MTETSNTTHSLRRVFRESIVARDLAEQMQPLADALIVTTTSPVQEVVSMLNTQPFALVSTLGQPVGVIMRDDLEKTPMRMWLFGMITLFEMTITRLLKQAYPGDSWREVLSSARVEKASQLQTERGRRNQQVELIDCLQLSDKGQVFAKSDAPRERFWKRSRTVIRGVVKQLESLRNNLAHSQPFIADN